MPESLRVNLTSCTTVIPVGPEHEAQSLMQYDKLSDGSIRELELFGVRYVPLVQRHR